MVAAKIAGTPGLISERSIPTHGSDWNDSLQAVKKTERTTNLAWDMPSL